MTVYNFIDLTGKVFGEWTVLERAAIRPNANATFWKVRCSCGLEKELSSVVLRYGLSKSCGHVRRNKVKVKVPKQRGKVGRPAKSDTVKHRALELVAQGYSYRYVSQLLTAEGMQVSYAKVSQWVAELDEKPEITKRITLRKEVKTNETEQTSD